MGVLTQVLLRLAHALWPVGGAAACLVAFPASAALAAMLALLLPVCPLALSFTLAIPVLIFLFTLPLVTVSSIVCPSVLS
jgi:hypothetical protein